MFNSNSDHSISQFILYAKNIPIQMAQGRGGEEVMGMAGSE